MEGVMYTRDLGMQISKKCDGSNTELTPLVSLLFQRLLNPLVGICKFLIHEPVHLIDMHRIMYTGTQQNGGFGVC